MMKICLAPQTTRLTHASWSLRIIKISRKSSFVVIHVENSFVIQVNWTIICWHINSTYFAAWSAKRSAILNFHLRNICRHIMVPRLGAAFATNSLTWNRHWSTTCRSTVSTRSIAKHVVKDFNTDRMQWSISSMHTGTARQFLVPCVQRCSRRQLTCIHTTHNVMVL